jgi:archaellum component FlaF (FlaF/FlaG flagellin family)
MVICGSAGILGLPSAFPKDFRTFSINVTLTFLYLLTDTMNSYDQFAVLVNMKVCPHERSKRLVMPQHDLSVTLAVCAIRGRGRLCEPVRRFST